MGAFTFQYFLVFVFMVAIFRELASKITIAIITTFIIASSIL